VRNKNLTAGLKKKVQEFGFGFPAKCRKKTVVIPLYLNFAAKGYIVNAVRLFCLNLPIAGSDSNYTVQEPILYL
jgi:hypothetical protein